jgi:hypothetical protein
MVVARADKGRREEEKGKKRGKRERDIMSFHFFQRSREAVLLKGPPKQI